MTAGELMQKLRSWPDAVRVQGKETGWESIHGLVEVQATVNTAASTPLVHAVPVRTVLNVGKRGHRRRSVNRIAVQRRYNADSGFAKSLICLAMLTYCGPASRNHNPQVRGSNP